MINEFVLNFTICIYLYLYKRIGKDCHIGDFVVVDDHCITGDNTIIFSRAGLQNTIIGDNCLIQSGTTIGEDGFVFEREAETSELEKFPHDGKVIIKNNVEIFSNCSI
jgi:UDP-3-O-[3-hydroxymyristoyl] glucosamine N-acyltransferase